MKMLIVAPTYAEAERIARLRTWDWLWFATVEIALAWLERCRDRGVVVNAVIRDPFALRVAA